MFKGTNVTIMVSDMDRAVKFYTEILGFTAGPRYGNEWAEATAPGLNIGLHPARHPAPPGGNLSIGLQVADLDAVMKTLKDKGVVFDTKITDANNLRIVNFKDPDQTQLYLIQSKY